MKLITKDEMKLILGGNAAGCAAQCTCPNGTIYYVSIGCEGSCSAQDGVGAMCDEIGAGITTCFDGNYVCFTP